VDGSRYFRHLHAALIARITRASMLDVPAQDYSRTVQAKGLGNLA
jgi:ABC-type dipeptide/oligopeptide/nickel transport system permease component